MTEKKKLIFKEAKPLGMITAYDPEQDELVGCIYLVKPKDVNKLGYYAWGGHYLSAKQLRQIATRLDRLNRTKLLKKL